MCQRRGGGVDSHLLPDGYAATDSRRPRPNAANGTFDIVTTECRRPDGCGACDKVARNSASFGDGPSPPRSDSLRTWLAVIPISCDETKKMHFVKGSRDENHDEIPTIGNLLRWQRVLSRWISPWRQQIRIYRWFYVKTVARCRLFADRWHFSFFVVVRFFHNNFEAILIEWGRERWSSQSIEMLCK